MTGGEQLRFWRALARRNEGSVTVWLLLSVIPLLVITNVAIATRTARASADWAQNALNRAAKAAAWQIPDTAYAAGSPYIDPARAEVAFLESLAYNMNLDPTTLEPFSPHSRIDSIMEYRLEVVNGPFPQVVINTEYDVDRAFTAPAVIATVRIRTNIRVLGQPVIIRKVAVAEVFER